MPVTGVLSNETVRVPRTVSVAETLRKGTLVLVEFTPRASRAELTHTSRFSFGRAKSPAKERGS